MQASAKNADSHSKSDKLLCQCYAFAGSDQPGDHLLPVEDGQNFEDVQIHGYNAGR